MCLSEHKVTFCFISDIFDLKLKLKSNQLCQRMPETERYKTASRLIKDARMKVAFMAAVVLGEE